METGGAFVMQVVEISKREGIAVKGGERGRRAVNNRRKVMIDIFQQLEDFLVKIKKLKFKNSRCAGFNVNNGGSG